MGGVVGGREEFVCLRSLVIASPSIKPTALIIITRQQHVRVRAFHRNVCRVRKGFDAYNSLRKPLGIAMIRLKVCVIL